MANHQLLNDAIQLIQAGQKTTAQNLLEPYLQTNPQDVTAWLWEARTCASLETRIKVLETCLAYNPNHPQILTVLAALNTQRNRSPSEPDSRYFTKRINLS